MIEKLKRPRNPFRDEIQVNEFGKDVKNYIYGERFGKFFKTRRVEAMGDKEKIEFAKYSESAKAWKENVKARKQERVDTRVKNAVKRASNKAERANTKTVNNLSRKIRKEELGKERKKVRLEEQMKSLQKKITEKQNRIKDL